MVLVARGGGGPVRRPDAPLITGLDAYRPSAAKPAPTTVTDPRRQAIGDSRAVRGNAAANTTDPRRQAIENRRAQTTQAAAAATSAGAPAGAAPPPGPRARDVVTGAIVNPPLHPLSNSVFLDGVNVPLQRGVMIRTQEVLGDDSTNIVMAQRYQFRFIYNPESVAFSSNVFQGMVPPGYQDPAATFQAKFVGQETLSFGLMIDRTQEVYEQGAVATRGTMPDVEALYKVVNGSKGIDAGFLYLSTVEVHWTRSATNSLPKFVGFVTSINVTHTKFTPLMTPIRSLVDISMTRISGTGATVSKSTEQGLI